MARWLQRRSAMLERAYRATAKSVVRLAPFMKWVGFKRIDRVLRPIEGFSKRMLFGCQMCGQCILHSTGMVCPMNCPKQLRNGACGGVRPNGNCEVDPDMQCVWVAAYEQAREMNIFGAEIIEIKPPVNRQLQGTSAWVNLVTGDADKPPKGWADLPHHPVIERELS